jgi:hypothetical protein
MAETFQKRQRGMRRKEKQLNKKLRKAERASAGPEEVVDGYNPLDELYRPTEEQDAQDRAENVAPRPEEGSDPTKQEPPKTE